jgi:hypothetical protein
MSVSIRSAAFPLILFGAHAALGTAQAAEGFEPRYNLAGSIGGEIFAPPDQTGWAFCVAATHIHVERVTGGDGRTLTQPVPGGTVALPAPMPAALSPAYGAQTAEIPAFGALDRWDLALAYFTKDTYAGGRLLFIADLPLARKKQTIVPQALTPALQWSPQAPAAMQAPVQAQFDSQYQGVLAAQGKAMTGEVRGLGDAELTAAWQYVNEKWRVLAGASLVLPTGKYSADPGPDIGTGRFKTLRPGVQIGYLPTPKLAFAAKLSLGLNTRNRDNQLRSGNWAGLEAAAGYMTPIGVVGVHAIRVQQYQDDDANPLGPSRFLSTNAGVFFTTMLPVVDAALTIQSITTRHSRYAKAGSFTQARLIKTF